MLTCKQASKLISQSLDRPLTWSEKVQLKLHLFICDPCMHFKQQLNTLRTALLKIRSSIENDSTIKLPLVVKDRIMHMIESKQI